MNVKDIKIRKGMNKEDINLLISEWITLEDSIYMGSNYKHNWRCKCGNIIKGRIWSNISRRNNIHCKICVNYNKSESEYKYLVEKTGEYEYIGICNIGEILSNEKPAKYKYLKIKHKYCGCISDVMISTVYKSNIGCSKCCKKYENSFAYHIEMELGLDIDDVWDFNKNNLNPYHITKNNNKKVWIKCQNEDVNEINGLMKKDYHESYQVSCSHFTSGKRCSYCNPNGRTSKIHIYDSFGYKNFDKVMSWHPDNEISPFRIAKSSGKKYKFICPFCEIPHNKSISKATNRGVICKECSISEGEKKIIEWLRYNNIRYEHEKTYKGLVGLGGGLLSYDFYLQDYNLLIEYQGEQHEEYTARFHSSYDDLKKQREHDRRKREYAKDNNIRLLEIWYYDFDNIEKILLSEKIIEMMKYRIDILYK